LIYFFNGFLTGRILLQNEEKLFRRLLFSIRINIAFIWRQWHLL
jgi:hypothetical protein